MANAKKLSNAMYTASPIVTNDTISRKDCKVISSYNTTGQSARVAPAILNALYYLLNSADHNVGIALNEERGEILIEKDSRKFEGRKDVVMFNRNTSTVMVCMVDENGNIFAEAPSVNTITMLHIVNLVSIDCDIATAFEKSKKYAKRTIALDDDTGLIFDAGYYAIESTFQNVEMDNLTFLDGSYTEGYIDITADTLGHNGKFWFANINAPVTSTVASKTKQLKTIGDCFEVYGKTPLLEAYRNSLSPEDLALIPDAHNDPELVDYILSDNFKENIALLSDSIANNYMHGKSVFLFGEPGSGKSTEGRAVAAVFGLPYRFDQFSRETALDRIIGGPVPMDGGGIMMDTNTAFNRSARYGGVHVFEDITYNLTGNTAFFNSVLESPFRYMDAANEVVDRHPLCIIYATANLDCAGANELLAALDSRFYINEERFTLDDKELAKAIMNRSGNTDKGEITTIVECYRLTCKLIEDTYGSDAPMPTMRNLIFWARQSTLLGGLLAASKKNFLGSLKFGKEFTNRVYTSIVMAKCPAKRK